MFQKRLKNLMVIKTPKQIYLEFKTTIQLCVFFFCILFIDFMLAGKSLIDFTNLFSPYDLKKKDKIILSYFR